MIRKKILNGVLGIGLALTMCVGIAQSETLKSTLSPKVARAALAVECYCSFWGTNNVCAANNGGAQCAPEGTTKCSTYNSNCEG